MGKKGILFQLVKFKGGNSFPKKKGKKGATGQKGLYFKHRHRPRPRIRGPSVLLNCAARADLKLNRISRSSRSRFCSPCQRRSLATLRTQEQVAPSSFFGGRGCQVITCKGRSARFGVQHLGGGGGRGGPTICMVQSTIFCFPFFRWSTSLFKSTVVWDHFGC